ncbi:GhoT/OrtT family toxin [Rhodococcus sp. (in: high G+C Gram-positive bacteria)]
MNATWPLSLPIVLLSSKTGTRS